MSHIEYVKTFFSGRLAEIDQCQYLFRLFFDFIISSDCLFECREVYDPFQSHLLV